jgi:hypothetical protein
MAKGNAKKKAPIKANVHAKYPRNSLEKALRIPKAILDQNAGKDCSDDEVAHFLGLKSAKGDFAVEISSSIKFGLLIRPSAGKLALTEIAKRILRPQNPGDSLLGLREAVMKAPDISSVYSHYRGEFLPDTQYFENALIDKFSIPKEKVQEFKEVFIETLKHAQLITEQDGRLKVLDVTFDLPQGSSEPSENLKRLENSVAVDANDSCFVMMPFAPPLGSYYEQIYKKAIEKAGLRPMRADSEIFGTGKIMDQIWDGINSAKVLVAELTTRNPNVFYELGIAHTLKKPVVLVSSNEADVPFDLKHIRVIIYDTTDPFWGNKLLEKVAENILSAIKNPEEAIFKSGN